MYKVPVVEGWSGRGGGYKEIDFIFPPSYRGNVMVQLKFIAFIHNKFLSC